MILSIPKLHLRYFVAILIAINCGECKMELA